MDGLSSVSWYEFAEEYDNLRAPQSEEEFLFVQKYGDSLWAAKDAAERYLSGTKSAYHKACAEYQQLYKKISAYIETWRRGFQLNLALVSPKLTAIEDSKLVVPGQYDPSVPKEDQQYIRNFDPVVEILSSKQLPRKIAIMGNRERFVFLLKGDEDLRQDQRIMQLVSLTNVLLNHNVDAFARQLFLQPYSVVPLSPNSGLLTWVGNTETLMQMIYSSRAKVKGNRTMDNELAALIGVPVKEFRQGGFDVERIMQKHDALPLATKVERFRSALAESDHSECDLY